MGVGVTWSGLTSREQQKKSDRVYQEQGRIRYEDHLQVSEGFVEVACCQHKCETIIMLPPGPSCIITIIAFHFPPERRSPQPPSANHISLHAYEYTHISESFLDITSLMPHACCLASSPQHPLSVVPANSCRPHDGHAWMRKAPCVFYTLSNHHGGCFFTPCAYGVRVIPHLPWNTVASVYISPTLPHRSCHGSRSSLNFICSYLLSLSLYM